MTALILPFTRRSEAGEPKRPIDVEAEPTVERTKPDPTASGVHIDGWGRDGIFVQRITTLANMRWHVTLGGVDRLPARAGALIIVNARMYSLAPVFTALALGEATGRPVRFVGRPDTAPVGALMRRLGGLLEHPDEVRNALRAKEVVVIGTGRELHPQRVGRIDHRMVGAAVQERVRVHPAAATSSPFSRNARVEIGAEVNAGRSRRGPLAELELSDAARKRIRNLLEELGGWHTGPLFDWLPMSGMGGD
ncbi:MAG: hypothetical protein M3337_04425 [Actinomycetota bacterium]|nr:hypothetical protein [Actinomycetota bacterium]